MTTGIVGSQSADVFFNSRDSGVCERYPICDGSFMAATSGMEVSSVRWSDDQCVIMVGYGHGHGWRWKRENAMLLPRVNNAKHISDKVSKRNYSWQRHIKLFFLETMLSTRAACDVHMCKSNAEYCLCSDRFCSGSKKYSTDRDLTHMIHGQWVGISNCS